MRFYIFYLFIFFLLIYANLLICKSFICLVVSNFFKWLSFQDYLYKNNFLIYCIMLLNNYTQQTYKSHHVIIPAT